MSSRLFKWLSVVVMLLAVTLSVVSCEKSDGASLIISSDTYIVEAGETVSIEEIRKSFLNDTEHANESVSKDTTDVPTDTTADFSDTESAQTDTERVTHEATVYWVDGGEVWHIRSSCPTLSRSKNIREGTVEQAMLAGKGRVCKRCGN